MPKIPFKTEAVVEGSWLSRDSGHSCNTQHKAKWAQTGHLRLAPRSAVRDIAADQSAGYLASMSSVEKTATTVVRQFNDCISRRDLDALSDMLAENHVFIDSAGNMISGKRACAKAWEGFFTAFPDYCNEFDRVEEKDGFVAVSGRSVCSDSRLHGPALWKAVVVADRMAEWHVLDNTDENSTLLGLSK